MSLVDKQSDFAWALGQLLTYAHGLLWAGQTVQLTMGDAYRDPRVPYGHPKSCHRARLACDLNLYVNGIWITDSAHPTWKLLGDVWETLDHRARWGGQGTAHPEGLKHDGNHFAFEHEGVQ
jgi:hypothetical protein